MADLHLVPNMWELQSVIYDQRHSLPWLHYQLSSKKWLGEECHAVQSLDFQISNNNSSPGVQLSTFYFMLEFQIPYEYKIKQVLVQVHWKMTSAFSIILYHFFKFWNTYFHSKCLKKCLLIVKFSICHDELFWRLEMFPTLNSELQRRQTILF